MNDEVMVEVRNVSKSYGKIRALDGISLEMTRGRIVGLIGANGAGKSTLLRHIIGLCCADKGECITLGRSATKLRPADLARIGYVHQEGELIDWMTVKQLIRYVSAYYKTWNHDLEEKYITDFEISLTERVGTLSPGQRQKLATLLAIAYEPELLILDEPAAALDPIARSQFLDLLLKVIQDRKRSIVISSHILSDIEKVIDHVIIMNKGCVLRDCSFAALRKEFIRFRLISSGGNPPEKLQSENFLDIARNSSWVEITACGISEEEAKYLANTAGCEMEIRPMSLEDLYKLVVSKNPKVTRGHHQG